TIPAPGPLTMNNDTARNAWLKQVRGINTDDSNGGGDVLIQTICTPIAVSAISNGTRASTQQSSLNSTGGTDAQQHYSAGTVLYGIWSWVSVGDQLNYAAQIYAKTFGVDNWAALQFANRTCFYFLETPWIMQLEEEHLQSQQSQEDAASQIDQLHDDL